MICEVSTGLIYTIETNFMIVSATLASSLILYWDRLINYRAAQNVVLVFVY